MLSRLIFGFTFLNLIALSSFSQVSIIPEPVMMNQKEGEFKFGNSITVGGDQSNSSIKKITEWLKEKLTVTGLPVTSTGANQKSDIYFSLNGKAEPAIGKEGYQLTVEADKGIVILANESAGLFYGAQTFLQLLPAAIERKIYVGFLIGYCASHRQTGYS